MRTEHTRAIERRSKAKRARIFRALGLNTNGREYRRHPNLKASQRPAYNRRYNLAKYHRRAARNFSKGLNTRGKPHVYLIVISADDAAVLDAEMDQLAAALAGCFHELPAGAQTHAIQLGHSLSNLRRRIRVEGMK